MEFLSAIHNLSLKRLDAEEITVSFVLIEAGFGRAMHSVRAGTNWHGVGSSKW